MKFVQMVMKNQIFNFLGFFFHIFQKFLLKIFFSETAGPINIIFDRDTLWEGPS